MKNTLRLFLTGAIAALALGLSIPLGAQSVHGIVSEKSTGEPVVGAALMIKGTSTGVSSDADGSYSLPAKEGDVIVCQFFGFKTIETTVGKEAVVNFIMEDDTQTLEQSVVVGYGTLKKTQLVGAVENLDGSALENRVNSDVTRSLQGQVAGLNIIQTDGKPNHSGSIYIRGNSTTYHTRKDATYATGETRSIGSGSGALVLIDGVEGTLSSVNPDDIETIAVLKDASSAAVYGARGAFGVILVTTKKPSEDRITVNYSGAFTMNERIIKWEDGIEDDPLTWARSFVEFYKGASRNPSADGTFPAILGSGSHINMPFSQEYLDELTRRAAGGYKNPVAVDENGTYIYYGNNNWVREMYTPHHFTQTHNLSVSGSGKRVSASLSGRIYDQGNIYKVGNENYRSYNIRSKVAIKITPWLTLDNNTSLNSYTYTQPYYDSGKPVIAHLIDYVAAPMFVAYNPDGSPTWAGLESGYVRFQQGNDFQTDRNLNIVTSTGLDVQILKDVLKIRGDFSYKATRFQRDRVGTPSSYSTAVGSYTDYITQESSFKSRWNQTTDYWQANIVATWTPKLGDSHDLNIVAGWNAENRDYLYARLLRYGLLYPTRPSFELMDGMDNSIYNDYTSDYAVAGFFGRVNYTLLCRYILEVSARYDGSSKFPAGKQWAFFPSASLGWRISEEPWLKGAKSWLDNLKLRANIGALGNANVSPYRFLESIGAGKTGILIDGSRTSYTGSPSIVPDNLTWERVTTYDIGLDWDILRSRLSFSGDYYVRNNTDVIISGTELPGIYGASAPDGNYGSIQTKGWELSLAWRDQFNLGGKPFSYSIKGSLWDSRTWVTEYKSISGTVFDYYKGKELGEIWGFRTDGIFMSNAEALNWAIDTFHRNGNYDGPELAGDLKFLDLNGDGRITAGAGTLDDHGDLAVIGNTTPHLQFGVNLDMNWNGIGLSLFFQGVGHRDWYPEVESGLFWGQYNRPYSALLKTQEGDNAVKIDYNTSNWVVTNADKNPYWTRQVTYAANRNMGPLSFENDHYLQNCAYVRLKNATLSYTLPQKVSKRLHLQKIRFYLTGENLLTFSPLYKHTKMFDPEGIESGDSDFGGASATGLNGVGNGYSYPMLKSYTIGINLTF